MKRETQLVLACLMASALAGVLTQVGGAYATRNASGTYSLPTGNPVVTGTAISSTVHNNTMADLATEITDSLNRSGKGAMLAGLQGYVGTVSLPGYTFAGDTNTGLYWISADSVGMAMGGVLNQSWATTGSTFARGVTANNSQTDGDGARATGNGAGYGVVGVGGGSSGIGGYFGGGAGNANGVVGVATGSGAGVYGNPGSTGYGIFALGNNTRGPVHLVCQSTAPSGAVEGDLYCDSDDHKLYFHTGSAWVVAGSQT